MKIESLQSGMTVYETHTYRMGNTTLRSQGVWPVTVVEVDMLKRRVLASWNGNRSEWYYEHQWSKWRLKKPKLIRTSTGGYRLARRGETPT